MDGDDGTAGPAGATGLDRVDCWDLNGCPSSSHSPPTGTLTNLVRSAIVSFDDGKNAYTSCNTAPNNGLLSIIYKQDTKQA